MASSDDWSCPPKASIPSMEDDWSTPAQPPQPEESFPKVAIPSMNDDWSTPPSLPRDATELAKKQDVSRESNTPQSKVTIPSMDDDWGAPPSPARDTTKTAKKRDAFAELMAPKPKAAKHETPATGPPGQQPRKERTKWNGALLEYIEHPELWPSVVLRVTENTVLIQDLYQKATVHLLLLPRSPKFYDLHPHQAFQDPEFLTMMKDEAASAARIAAAELSREISRYSVSNKARSNAMDAGTPFDELPAGRDYLKDIRIGIHAHPSMAHLHVHIISRDMVSGKLKHKKHYNSFNTPFFIPLDDYPLAADDQRRNTSFQNSNLNGEFVCWRCGASFKHKFKELKAHLEIEFAEWVKE